MRIFSNPEVEQKYRNLGFAPCELSFKLSLGNVSVYAVEHMWNGVRLTFESFTARTMSQYSVSVPERCSAEQIAGLICVNIAQNHPDNASAWRSHFEGLGLRLFQ